MKTGVCYHPEHWPEEQWAKDAARMRELGLRVVRMNVWRASSMASIPPVLMFFAMQKHFIAGLTLGATKGKCAVSAVSPLPCSFEQRGTVCDLQSIRQGRTA